MFIRRLGFACAAVLALSSCVTPAPRLTAEALLAEPYVRSSASPFDVAVLFDALPDWIDTSYSDAGFDPATGSMAVSDLVFALRDAPDYRLRVDHANIWGGDADAAQALAAGDVVGAPALIFERASLEGVRSEGLYWSSGAQTAAFSVDKVVYDGFSARSIDVTAKPGAPEIAAFLQKMAAISLAVKLDGAAYSNMVLRLNESQGSEVFMSVAQGFMRGYDSGRTEYERVDGYALTTREPGGASVLKQVADAVEKQRKPRAIDKILQPHVRETLDKALDNPIAFIAASTGGITTEQEVDAIEVRNVDIAGGLRWLAKWELPPITETELLDFGAMTVLGSRESWNGAPITSTDRTEISSADFYWLIPSNIEVREVGATMAPLNFFDVILDAYEVGLAPESGSLEIQEVRETLTALGLETIRADSSFSWLWNGDTGALDTGGAMNVVDLASQSSALSLDGPSLAELHPLMRADATEQQFAAAMMGVALREFRFSVTDDQLLDRVFAYAAQDTGSAPAELRQTITEMVRGMGVGAAEMNPRILGYSEAIAGFIAGSGTIDIGLSPAAPVTLETLAGISETAPQTLPDVLNLEITHTPR